MCAVWSWSGISGALGWGRYALLGHHVGISIRVCCCVYVGYPVGCGIFMDSPISGTMGYGTLSCTVLYCTELYCTALHCTELPWTALYCTALNWTEHCALCTVQFWVVLPVIYSLYTIGKLECHQKPRQLRQTSTTRFLGPSYIRHLPFFSVRLGLPPMDSETGWTGELLSNRALLILEN